MQHENDNLKTKNYLFQTMTWMRTIEETWIPILKNNRRVLTDLIKRNRQNQNCIKLLKEHQGLQQMQLARTSITGDDEDEECGSEELSAMKKCLRIYNIPTKLSSNVSNSVIFLSRQCFNKEIFFEMNYTGKKVFHSYILTIFWHNKLNSAEKKIN